MIVIHDSRAGNFENVLSIIYQLITKSFFFDRFCSTFYRSCCKFGKKWVLVRCCWNLSYKQNEMKIFFRQQLNFTAFVRHNSVFWTCNEATVFKKKIYVF